jgi:hypothetical protein
MFTALNSASGQIVNIISSKVVPLIITIIFLFLSTSSSPPPPPLGQKLSPTKD